MEIFKGSAQLQEKEKAETHVGERAKEAPDYSGVGSTKPVRYKSSPKPRSRREQVKR